MSNTQVIWLHNNREVNYKGPRLGVSHIVDKSQVMRTNYSVLVSSGQVTGNLDRMDSSGQVISVMVRSGQLKSGSDRLHTNVSSVGG